MRLLSLQDSSHSLDRRQSVGTGVMTTFSRDPRVSHVTLPRGRHVRDKIKSEECLMLSCQVFQSLSYFKHLKLWIFCIYKEIANHASLKVAI